MWSSRQWSIYNIEPNRTNLFITQGGCYIWKPPPPQKKKNKHSSSLSLSTLTHSRWMDGKCLARKMKISHMCLCKSQKGILGLRDILKLRLHKTKPCTEVNNCLFKLLSSTLLRSTGHLWLRRTAISEITFTHTWKKWKISSYSPRLWYALSTNRVSK